MCCLQDDVAGRVSLVPPCVALLHQRKIDILSFELNDADGPTVAISIDHRSIDLLSSDPVRQSASGSPTKRLTPFRGVDAMKANSMGFSACVEDFDGIAIQYTYNFSCQIMIGLWSPVTVTRCDSEKHKGQRSKDSNVPNRRAKL
jgi:hypothetical protein